MICTFENQILIVPKIQIFIDKTFINEQTSSVKTPELKINKFSKSTNFQKINKFSILIPTFHQCTFSDKKSPFAFSLIGG